MTKQTTYIKMGKKLKVAATGLSGSVTTRDLLVAAFKIDANITETKSQSGGLSGYVFELAQKYQDADSFLSAIEREEDFFKSDHGRSFLKQRKVPFEVSDKTGLPKLPRCWSQYKSNIKQGWSKFDLDPSNYDSESEYRAALNEARKAAKAEDNTEVKQIDQDIAGLLVQVADVYEGASDDAKGEIFTGLQYMIDYHKAVSKEVA